VFNNYNNIELKEAYLENNGHSVELVIPEQDIGSAKLSGGPLSGSYQLHQLHFHWGEDNSKGSEHTVDGKRFPLEMHLVHVTTDIPYKSTEYPVPHGLAVVSFLFQISDEDNKNMPPITDKIKSISKSHTETDMENFKLSDLISEASEGGYFTYDGSLTTPSCDEVVHWIVFQTPISISSRQIAKYRMAHDSSGARLVNNFRPIQDLNDRTVYNVRSNTSNR
jgi:carbonic anhydrase